MHTIAVYYPVQYIYICLFSHACLRNCLIAHMNLNVHSRYVLPHVLVQFCTGAAQQTYEICI